MTGEYSGSFAPSILTLPLESFIISLVQRSPEPSSDLAIRTLNLCPSNDYRLPIGRASASGTGVTSSTRVASPDNAYFDIRGVSKVHGHLYVKDRKLYFQDNESRNGTKITMPNLLAVDVVAADPVLLMNLDADATAGGQTKLGSFHLSPNLARPQSLKFDVAFKLVEEYHEEDDDDCSNRNTETGSLSPGPLSTNENDDTNLDLDITHEDLDYYLDSDYEHQDGDSTALPEMSIETPILTSSESLDDKSQENSQENSQAKDDECFESEFEGLSDEDEDEDEDDADEVEDEEDEGEQDIEPVEVLLKAPYISDAEPKPKNLNQEVIDLIDDMNSEEETFFRGIRRHASASSDSAENPSQPLVTLKRKRDDDEEEVPLLVETEILPADVVIDQPASVEEPASELPASEEPATEEPTPIEDKAPTEEPEKPRPTKRLRTALTQLSTFALGAAAGSVMTIAALIASAPQE